MKQDLRVNDRPVYKQSKGNLYVYYWVTIQYLGNYPNDKCFMFYEKIFDEGRNDDGENWLVR